MDSLSIPSLLSTACFEFTNSVSCAWRGLARPLRYETQSHHKSTWQCLCFHFLLRSCFENVPKRDAGESVFASQKRVRWGDWKILNLTQIFFYNFRLAGHFHSSKPSLCERKDNCEGCKWQPSCIYRRTLFRRDSGKRITWDDGHESYSCG